MAHARGARARPMVPAGCSRPRPGRLGARALFALAPLQLSPGRQLRSSAGAGDELPGSPAPPAPRLQLLPPADLRRLQAGTRTRRWARSLALSRPGGAPPRHERAPARPARMATGWAQRVHARGGTVRQLSLRLSGRADRLLVAAPPGYQLPPRGALGLAPRRRRHRAAVDLVRARSAPRARRTRLSRDRRTGWPAARRHAGVQGGSARLARSLHGWRARWRATVPTSRSGSGVSPSLARVP